LTLAGEDVNGNKAGAKSKKIQEIKIVETGTPTISASTNKATVLRRASDSVIATFTVKPANGASETDLEEIKFTLSKDGGNFFVNANDDADHEEGGKAL